MDRPARSPRPFLKPGWFKPWMAAVFCLCLGCRPTEPAVPPLPTLTAGEVADILVSNEPTSGDEESPPRSIPQASIPQVLALLPTAVRVEDKDRAAWPWWGTLTIVLNAGGTVQLPFYSDDQQNVVLQHAGTGEYYRTKMHLNRLRKLAGSPTISNL